MAKILLSLGSNLGNRIDNIERAIKMLSSKCCIIKTSSFYETEPFGYKEQDWFINIVVFLETDLHPFNFLIFCKTIEYILGRRPSPHWTARIIDIDILLYDDLIFDDGKVLTIPHKYLEKRNFVLVPAVEIVPNMLHPVYNQKLIELQDLCKDTSKVFCIMN